MDAICNLQTLENLRVLRLDNNKISKIENLGHLVNLEWLGEWGSPTRMVVCATFMKDVGDASV